MLFELQGEPQCGPCINQSPHSLSRPYVKNGNLFSLRPLMYRSTYSPASQTFGRRQQPKRTKVNLERSRNIPLNNTLSMNNLLSMRLPTVFSRYAKGLPLKPPTSWRTTTSIHYHHYALCASPVVPLGLTILATYLKVAFNLRVLDIGPTPNTDLLAELGLDSCCRPRIIFVDVRVLTPTLHLLSLHRSCPSEWELIL